MEAELAEISSMSESEILDVKEEQACTKQETTRKCLDFPQQYSRCCGMSLPLLMLSDSTPSVAVPLHNIVSAPPGPPRPATMDDCAAVALERMEPDG